MAHVRTAVRPSVARLAVLREVEQRVLWLATRIVDAANRRDTADGEVKVGGHQASSASMVSIMTALWFAHIGGDDKVAVKPHASPVYHAIKYLTGELDRSYLTDLAPARVASRPTRRAPRIPTSSDFSTGSVGLGAVAPAVLAPSPVATSTPTSGLVPRCPVRRARGRCRARRRQRLGGDRRAR